jgi:hypothetical protein
MAPRANAKDVQDNNLVIFEDMQLFMRSLGKRRLELLECLKQCGPSSLLELVSMLRRRKMAIVDDVAFLVEYELLYQDDKDRFFVPWTTLVATVQHKNYLHAKNVRNLVDCYLFLSARKHNWLKVNIKLRVIERGVPKFTCSLEPIFN